jgi:hypothetical protein
MNQSLAHKIGFWSSLLFAILGFILIAANIGIGFAGQWQVWVGMEAYAAWYSSLRVNLFTISFIASFLMAILFLGIMAVLHSLAPDEKKVLGMLGISFTVVCVTLVSITYYTQLSIVRNSIQSGQVEELARFVYHSPNSFVFAIDILGFFFLGLAALCVAPLLEGTLRWLFVAFGIENIVGLLAHTFDKQLVLLFYNLVMTFTIFLASILLTIHFGRGRGTQSKVWDTNRSSSGYRRNG